MANLSNINNKFLVTTGGDVGIGVTGPSAKLDVNGTIKTNAIFRGDTLNNNANTHNIIYRSGTSTFIAGGDKLVVQDGGNVGIGTTSPAYKLVVSDGGATGLEVIPSTSSSNVNLLSFDRSASLYRTLALTGIDITFNNEFGRKMTLDTAGNFGIGTASPGAKLDVNDTNKAINTKGNLFVSTTDTLAADKGGQISLGGVWAGTSQIQFAGIAGRKENATSGNAGGYLQLSTTASSGGALTERMRINSSGNVGIGTTSPTNLLSLRKDVAGGDVAIYLQNYNSVVGSTDETVSIKFAHGNDGGSGYVGAKIVGGKEGDFESSPANVKGFMSFYTNEGSLTSQVEQMRINGDGNVGIGVTLPAAKLDVLKETRISYLEGNQYRTRITNTDGNTRILSDGQQSSIIFGTTGNVTAGTASEKMWIDWEGKVGIGTSSPAGKFEIKSAASNYTTAPAITFTDDTGVADSRWILGNIATNYGNFVLAESDSATTVNYSPRITVIPGGSVGIGTTNPLGKLNINTGLTGITYDMVNQANGSISFGNNSGGTAAPTITGKSNNNLGLMLVSGTNDTGPVADMYFDVRENDDTDYSTLTSSAYRFNRAGNPLMTILRSGNVGIGTTTPYSRLDVSGIITNRTASADPNFTVTANGMSVQNSGSLQFTQGFSGTSSAGDTVVFTYSATLWKSWNLEFVFTSTGNGSGQAVCKGNIGGYNNNNGGGNSNFTQNFNTPITAVATNSGQHVIVTFTGDFGIHMMCDMRYSQGGGDGSPRADRASLTYNS